MASVVSLGNPLDRADLGPNIEAAIQKMSGYFAPHGLNLLYNPDTKTFTVLESSARTPEQIRKISITGGIWGKHAYKGYLPEMNGTDESGNHQIRLVPKPNSDADEVFEATFEGLFKLGQWR